MKLLEITKSRIDKNKIGEKVLHLGITEVVLVQSLSTRVMYTFVPNKSFSKLLDILPKNFIFLKTFNSEFFYIEVWFTDQNSKLLDVEDKVSITLVIN